MNHLILFAHPNPESFGGTLCEKLRAFSESKGNKVVVRNLYAISFDPVLSAKDLSSLAQAKVPADIAQEHAYIKEADHITLLYPVWWGGMPAILKGYIDRVFSNGFAYEAKGEEVIALLTGKKSSVICTTGATDEEYEQSGIHAAMQLISSEVVFRFCGITQVKQIFFGNITGEIEEKRKSWLAGIEHEFAGIL